MSGADAWSLGLSIAAVAISAVALGVSWWRAMHVKGARAAAERSAAAAERNVEIGDAIREHERERHAAEAHAARAHLIGKVGVATRLLETAVRVDAGRTRDGAHLPLQRTRTLRQELAPAFAMLDAASTSSASFSPTELREFLTLYVSAQVVGSEADRVGSLPTTTGGAGMTTEANRLADAVSGLVAELRSFLADTIGVADFEVAGLPAAWLDADFVDADGPGS